MKKKKNKKESTRDHHNFLFSHDAGVGLIIIRSSIVNLSFGCFQRSSCLVITKSRMRLMPAVVVVVVVFVPVVPALDPALAVVMITS